MASAVGPLQIALWTAIQNDPDLYNLLDGEKIYSIQAPEDAPMPFIVFRNSGEENFNVFQRKGKLGAEDFGIHSERMDKEELLDIYDRLERILNGTRLPLGGHIMISGTLTLITVVPDEFKGTQLVARYVPLTQEAV